MRDDTRPLVYSCSGCSSAAQTANEMARLLDRWGHAQWSCIAGVGGDVKPLVKLARSGRSIVAIDGCPLECVRHCLARHDIVPTRHIQLHFEGVKKANTDFDPVQAEALARDLATELAAAPLDQAA